MGWTELRERGGSSEHMPRMKSLIMEAKEKLEEVCEMVEDMGEESYGERRPYSSDSMGMRRGYRIYQDDDDYGERRRRDSRGRYM